MKIIIAILSVILSLTHAINLHSPLDDIENHDEFNVADVDGLGGFDEVEKAYRKRGLPVPESIGGWSRDSMIDDLAAKELAARVARK